MTFAVLAGVGSAIAAGAAAVGDIGAAVAASVLPEAIGGGAAGAGGLGSLMGGTAGLAAGAAPSVAGMFPAGATTLGSLASEAGIPGAASAMGGGAGQLGLGSLGSSLISAGTNALMPGAGMQRPQTPSALQAPGRLTPPTLAPSSGISVGAQGAGQSEQQKVQQAQGERVGLGANVGMAQGGEVPLEDGQWIVPADVVSALGNGSTDGGARFLDQYFGAQSAG